MADLALPFFNLVILGSFMAWGIVQYVKLERNRAK